MTPALILMYHAIDAGPPPLHVDPALLARHLDCIVESGAPVLTVGALAARLRAGDPPDRAIAISFDDGFASVAREAAPLLAERGLVATVFCVAERLGRRADWPGAAPLDLAAADELAGLARAGWEIGSHGLRHARLGPDGIDRELVESRRALEDAVGVEVRSFAYPYGTVPGGGRAALDEAGYTAACTTRLALAGPGADPLALPRVDAHYLRRPSLLGAVLAGRGAPYLRARALAAGARRLVVSGG